MFDEAIGGVRVGKDCHGRCLPRSNLWSCEADMFIKHRLSVRCASAIACEEITREHPKEFRALHHVGFPMQQNDRDHRCRGQKCNHFKNALSATSVHRFVMRSHVSVLRVSSEGEPSVPTKRF